MVRMKKLDVDSMKVPDTRQVCMDLTQGALFWMEARQLKPKKVLEQTLLGMGMPPRNLS